MWKQSELSAIFPIGTVREILNELVGKCIKQHIKTITFHYQVSYSWNIHKCDTVSEKNKDKNVVS